MSAKGTVHWPRDMHYTYDQETDKTVWLPDGYIPPGGPIFNLRWFWRPEQVWHARLVEPGDRLIRQW